MDQTLDFLLAAAPLGFRHPAEGCLQRLEDQHCNTARRIRNLRTHLEQRPVWLKGDAVQRRIPCPRAYAVGFQQDGNRDLAQRSNDAPRAAKRRSRSRNYCTMLPLRYHVVLTT
jgi:hypothetical protein